MEAERSEQVKRQFPSGQHCSLWWGSQQCPHRGFLGKETAISTVSHGHDTREQHLVSHSLAFPGTHHHSSWYRLSHLFLPVTFPHRSAIHTHTHTHPALPRVGWSFPVNPPSVSHYNAQQTVLPSLLATRVSSGPYGAETVSPESPAPSTGYEMQQEGTTHCLWMTEGFRSLNKEKHKSSPSLFLASGLNPFKCHPIVVHKNGLVIKTAVFPIFPKGKLTAPAALAGAVSCPPCNIRSPFVHNWIFIWTRGCWAQLYSIAECGRLTSWGHPSSPPGRWEEPPWTKRWEAREKTRQRGLCPSFHVPSNSQNGPGPLRWKRTAFLDV